MLSLDTLPYVRMQALTFIYQLLRERPEQEHNLLRLLINKLVRSSLPYTYTHADMIRERRVTRTKPSAPAHPTTSSNSSPPSPT